MATLSRVTAKLFGGSADPNIVGQIGQFGSAKAGTKLNTADVATIQALAAYSTGWAAAVLTGHNFPPIEEVTGVLKTLSYQICYGLQEGIPTWDAGTEYSATSVVKSFSGNTLTLYKSKIDGNINHSVTDDDYWTPALIVGEREIGVPQITLDFTGSLPANCIDLDGSEISKNTYNDLYSVYQDTYNKGDEQAGNFRLPDFTDRAIYGGTSAGYINAGLPNLGITISGGNHKHTGSTGSGTAHRHGMGTLSYNSSGKLNYVIINENANFSRSGNITLTNNSIDQSSTYGFDGDDICRKATLNVDVSGGTWSGNMAAESAHTHSVSIDYSTSHSHSVSYTNAIVGSSNTVLTNGIKVRVFTRYK